LSGFSAAPATKVGSGTAIVLAAAGSGLSRAAHLVNASPQREGEHAMKRFLWSLALGAAMTAPTSVLAQDATTVPAADEPPDYNTGALTLTGGVDWTTAYFFRGYNQEDTGAIFQPYATVTAALVSNDNFTLNGYVGTWNSYHSKKTLSSGSGNSGWYESDVFGGLDFVFGKITLGTVYTFYTYPNGAFHTIQEIGFKVAYDDTDFMKNNGIDFALKPYAAVYFETDDANGSEDSYLEFGIAPTLGLGSIGGNPLTLSVPVVLGCSIDDYYLDSGGDNEFFGYASIGGFVSIPIGAPSKYGTWTLTGGIQYIYLMADSAEVANDGGENYELLGKVGVSFAY
jgi:hypothetical protein